MVCPKRRATRGVAIRCGVLALSQRYRATLFDVSRNPVVVKATGTTRQNNGPVWFRHDASDGTAYRECQGFKHVLNRLQATVKEFEPEAVTGLKRAVQLNLAGTCG